MKKTEIAFLLSLSLVFASFGFTKNTGTIEVKISGITKVNGQVVINVFTTSKGFPTKPELSYKEFKILIKNLNPTTIIELPVGEYAISVFQDENLNNKVNTNFFNIPTEKVGVSNNPKTLFVPSNEDAKFSLSTSKIVKKYN